MKNPMGILLTSAAFPPQKQLSVSCQSQKFYCLPDIETKRDARRDILTIAFADSGIRTKNVYFCLVRFLTLIR